MDGQDRPGGCEPCSHSTTSSASVRQGVSRGTRGASRYLCRSHRKVSIPWLTPSTGFPSRPTYNDYERLLVARLMTVKTLLEPGLPKTAINALADYFLCIAGHLEEQAFATNIVLIDEIDRCCMACARASGYVSWYSPSNYNCRDIIDTIFHAGVDGSGEKDVFEQIDVATELDIVSYAAAFGLFLYTKAKICERPSLCQRSDKLPILHAIHCVDIASVGEAFGKPSWQRLLRTLLDGDADPNLEYKGKSAWRWVQLSFGDLQNVLIPLRVLLRSCSEWV